jgi:MFS family permease
MANVEMTTSVRRRKYLQPKSRGEEEAFNDAGKPSWFRKCLKRSRRAYCEPVTSQRRALAAASLAGFLVLLAGPGSFVAMPALVRELGGILAIEQWVMAAYLISLGSLLLAGHALAEKHGAVRMLRLGLVLFAITAVVAAIAPFNFVVVIARVLQGASGALILSAALALLTATFSQVERPRAAITWIAWMLSALIVGPLLGGLVVDLAPWSWRLVFAADVIPAIVALAILRSGSHRAANPERAVDRLGATFAVVGLAGPVAALIEQEKHGWRDPIVDVPLVIGVLCIGLLIWRKRSGMRRPRAGLGWLALALGVASFELVIFAATIYVQDVLLQNAIGSSALLSSLVILPAVVALILVCWLLARSATRSGSSGSAMTFAVPTVGTLAAVAFAGLIAGNRLDADGVQRAIAAAAVLLALSVIFWLLGRARKS